MSTNTNSKTLRAYVECALWSSHDESTPSGGEPMDANYDIDDIDPATLAQMQSDVDDFVNNPEIAALLEASGLSDDKIGHDFWLTRNGHGAGFWDRGLSEIGRKLSDACKPYGGFDLYVGDDGRIYGQ